MEYLLGVITTHPPTDSFPLWRAQLKNRPFIWASGADEILAIGNLIKQYNAQVSEELATCAAPAEEITDDHT